MINNAKRMSVFKKFKKKKKINVSMRNETELNKVRKHISETVAWALHWKSLNELEYLIERHYTSSPSSLDRLTLDEREVITEAWSKIAEQTGIDPEED
jgi:hypothetical protein